MHGNEHIPLLAVTAMTDTNPPTTRRARGPSAARALGFTLVELMVTLAIGVVLMVVAVPGFVQFRNNAQLSDTVSSLILASGTAKSAALKSGKNAFVVVNDTTAGWRSGWYVFLDNNWDQTYDAGDEVLLRHDAVSTDVAVSAPGTTALSAGYLLFNATGFPKTKTGAVGTSASGTVVMATPYRSSTVIVDTAGRVRSCKTDSAGCSAL